MADIDNNGQRQISREFIFRRDIYYCVMVMK
jgi:hypothetical protein